MTMWMVGMAALLTAAAPANVPGGEGDVPAIALVPLQQQRVLDELNRARGAPQAYVRDLQTFRSWHRGDRFLEPGRNVAVITEEGVAAVDEAIDHAAHQRPVPPLAYSPLLSRAAADHVAYLADGHLGHEWDDGTGPGERAERRGGGPYVGEIIAFGSDDPAGVVRQFIVDDGVPDRGHREAVFSTEYRYAGIACGPHRTYRRACVVALSETPDGR